MLSKCSVLLVLLLTCCGGGGGAATPPPSQQRIIVVNSAPGVTLTEIFLDAFEDGNIINQYATVNEVISLASGEAVALDQVQVDTLYASLPGTSGTQVGMDSFASYSGGISPGLNLIGTDLRWAPDEGDYIFQVIPNPNFPATEPDDPYAVVKLSPVQYQQLLALGTVVELP